MDEKTEQVCINACFKTRKSALKTYELSKTVFQFITVLTSDKCQSRSNGFILWWPQIQSKDGHKSVEDDLQSGQHSTSKTNKNIVKVRNLVCSHYRLTIREIADELKLSF